MAKTFSPLQQLHLRPRQSVIRLPAVCYTAVKDFTAEVAAIEHRATATDLQHCSAQHRSRDACLKAMSRTSSRGCHELPRPTASLQHVSCTHHRASASSRPFIGRSDGDVKLLQQFLQQLAKFPATPSAPGLAKKPDNRWPPHSSCRWTPPRAGRTPSRCAGTDWRNVRLRAE